MRDTQLQELRRFERAYPDYRETRSLDRMRHREYSRLDRLGHTYLDYTGGSLYADRQLEQHRRFLSRNVLGNPHSHNPTSALATSLADEAREAVLRFFNASPEEYDVVFTSNASNAIKLVGEAYPFDSNSCYLMTFDNHNSVNGVREYAARASARIHYVPVRQPDLRVDDTHLRLALQEPQGCSSRLFAYPAQSNFSGVQHPLEWVDAAHEAGWDVLCDCAAYTPTNRLDLSQVKPDYVPISFYKLFGYPTGVGALIARHAALEKLVRPWFSGGTIFIVSVRNNWFHRVPGHIGFEDGTIDYTNLPAVTFGLQYLEEVGVDVIHARVAALTSYLLERLVALRHSNGSPLVRLYGPADHADRGGTISFGLFDPVGCVFDVNEVERRAGEARISVRTGCFCNPGDREVAHGIDEVELGPCFATSDPVTPDDCNRAIFDRTGTLPSGIRVSLGIASNFDDCYRFIGFLERFRDVRAQEVGGQLYAR